MPHLQHESIRIEIRERVAHIILNRPDSINAINNAMRTELPRALRELDADDSVTLIAIRGAGMRGFCSGADLKERPPSGAPTPSETSSWIQALDGVCKPLVAAIHGICFGGGLEIALACDMRIAAADAKFALPETSLGLIPGGGGTQRLPRLIGAGRALAMMMTGERIDALEAERIGLVSKVFPANEAWFERAEEFVSCLAQRPPIALRYVKEATHAASELALAEGLGLERRLFVRLLGTADHREAAAAFREKRTPAFRNC